MITRWIARRGVLVMDGVGCAVSVGGGVGASVDVGSAFGSVAGTAIGLDISHASKNNRVRMAKAGYGLIFIWLILMGN
jgi:hypothetical protein